MVVCEDLAQLAEQRVDDAAQTCAWQLLLRVVAHALDYDMQICDPEALEPILLELAAAMRQAAERILGKHLDDGAWAQIALPTRFGGMGLQIPSLQVAATAYWAAVEATADEVRRIATANCRPILHAPDLGVKIRAQAILREAGLEVSSNRLELTPFMRRMLECALWKMDVPPGMAFSLDGETAVDVQCETANSGSTTTTTSAPPPNAQANYRFLEPIDKCSRRRLQGRIMRGLDLAAAVRAWDRQRDHRRRRAMFEAGGPGAGATWTAPPGRHEVKMTGAQWLTGVLLRLALMTRPPGCDVCQIYKAGRKRCSAKLDDDLGHVSNCNSGPARHRPHECVKHALGHKLRRAGAHIDVERFVPELYTPDHEAILDLSVSFPGSAEVHLLDITVRNPEAAGRAKADGSSSVEQRAKYDKGRRYGPTVVPIIIGHRGRMPQSTREALAKLAAEARRWAVPKLGQRPGVPLSALQLTIEAAALRAVADAHLLAVGAHSAAALGWQLARQVAARSRGDTQMCRACPEEAAGDLEQQASPEADLAGKLQGVGVADTQQPEEEEDNIFSFPLDLN